MLCLTNLVVRTEAPTARQPVTSRLGGHSHPGGVSTRVINAISLMGQSTWKAPLSGRSSGRAASLFFPLIEEGSLDYLIYETFGPQMLLIQDSFPDYFLSERAPQIIFYLG